MAVKRGPVCWCAATVGFDPPVPCPVHPKRTESQLSDEHLAEIESDHGGAVVATILCADCGCEVLADMPLCGGSRIHMAPALAQKIIDACARPTLLRYYDPGSAPPSFGSDRDGDD